MFNFVVWLIVGIINLVSVNEISKISYGIVWIYLLINLLMEIL